MKITHGLSILILFLGLTVSFILSNHDSNISPEGDLPLSEFLEGKWEHINEKYHEKYLIEFFSKSFYSYTYIRTGDYPQEYHNVLFSYEIIGENTIKRTSIDIRHNTHEGNISRDGDLLLLSPDKRAESREFSRIPYFSWKDFGLYSFASISIWMACLWITGIINIDSIFHLKPKINTVILVISLPISILLSKYFYQLDMYMPWKLIIEIELLIILLIFIVITNLSLPENIIGAKPKRRKFVAVFLDYAYSVIIFICIEIIFIDFSLSFL